MKDLLIKKENRRIKSIQEIELFENEKQLIFPEQLKQLFLKYEGCRIDENQSYYKDSDNNVYEINQFLYLRDSELGGTSIEAILEGHKFYKIEGFIPFAIDSGGWDYNISIKNNSYGEIWINKFSPGEEDSMFFVSSSLDKFIDGLGNEE
jgi:hypothetical protein